MTASIPIDHLIRSVPFFQAEWDQTPSAIQAHLAALDTTVTTLELSFSVRDHAVTLPPRAPGNPKGII